MLGFSSLFIIIRDESSLEEGLLASCLKPQGLGDHLGLVTTHL